jgi:archaellum component FlaF (FlaF/FlaG flagellin family)
MAAAENAEICLFFKIINSYVKVDEAKKKNLEKVHPRKNFFSLS